jgi:L-alanine-DL-glutamate epimerase-like enolase superfamily enzyme
MPTIDLPDDELAAVAAAIRRAIEDDNIPTIEDLCRAGGVDGYVRARVDQAVAEVSKRARIEALEDCKRVLDA